MPVTYPICKRNQYILDNIDRDFLNLNHLNNYEFITSDTTAPILLELSKFLGFDLTRDTTISIYSKDYRQFHTLTYPIPFSQKMKKVLFHYKSHLINKQHLRGTNIRFLEKEKRISEYFAITKHKNIALREYAYSEVIGMDIDTHTYFDKKISLSGKRLEFEELCQNLFNTLKTNIPIHILYMETSKIQRGIHIYFKLENCHNKLLIEQGLKKFLEEEFKGLKVEYRTKTHPLRLPLSSDYQCRDVDTFKKKYKLKNIIVSTLNRQKKDLVSNNDILNHLKMLNKEDEVYMPTEIFSLFYRNNKLTNLDLAPTSPIEKFKIYKNNRVGGDGTQWRLLNWCLHYNKSLEEFINLTVECNINSKDISSWNNKELYDNCKKMYDYAKARFKPLKNYVPKNRDEHEFISNIYLTQNIHKRIVKSYLNHFENILPYSKQKKRFIKDCKFAFLEFLGKIEYEKLCPRSISKNLKLTAFKKSELLLGYQFPKAYLISLKKSYKMKSDINVIFKTFKSIFLEEIVHSNGTLYIPSLSSKQFKLISFYENRILLYKTMTESKGLIKVSSGVILQGSFKRQGFIKKLDFIRNFLETKHIIMNLNSNVIFESLNSLSYSLDRRMIKIREFLHQQQEKYIDFIKKHRLLQNAYFSS